MILIRKNKEIYGPFEREQVEDMLIEGRVRLDDAAKEAESGEWRELVEVLYTPAQPKAPSPSKTQPPDIEELPLNARETSERLARDRRDIAAFMAGQGKATWNNRVKNAIKTFLIGCLFFFIPGIGWIIGTMFLVMSPVCLFDDHAGKSGFENRIKETVGRFKNDGYQDRFEIGLAVILTVITLLLFWHGWSVITDPALEPERKNVGIYSLFGGLLLCVPIVWSTYKYFVPKQDR